MKILIVADYFPPQNSIASLRPYSWAKYWSKMGHDITVLTTKKNKKENDLNLDCSLFTIVEVENSFKEKLKQILGKKVLSQNSNVTNNGVDIKSIIKNKIKLFFEKRGILATARMPDFNDFIINKAYLALENERYDLVISTAGPYSEHLIAKKFKENKRTNFWIADYRDLWTQNHIFKGLFPFTCIEEYLEKKVNNSADMITTVSDPLAMQVKEKYKLNNVEVIENGFDFEDLETIPQEPFWSDAKVRLIYTGSIYKGKQDPSPLFKAISMIQNSSYKILLAKLEIIFIGGSKADLDELIVKYNVSNWVFHGGFLPREYSLQMQRDAHALIFLEFMASGVDGILTGKLFEYICSGTQILGIGTTDNSTSGKLIHDSGHGINFGRDSQLLKSYLIEILIHNSKKKITKNWEIIDKYSRKKQAESLLYLVEIYKK